MRTSQPAPQDLATVYNVQVEEYHTYFVGGTDWGFSVWAHNSGNCWVDFLKATKGTFSGKNWMSKARADYPAWKAKNAPSNPNRGVMSTTERTGRPGAASSAYEDSLTGASSGLATQRRNVPALRYDNPNPNPAGNNFVRFDGVNPANPNVLIDRKWGVTTRSDQVSKFQQGPLEALRGHLET